MKHLLILLCLVGCYNEPRFQVGECVKTRACYGRIATVYEFTKEYRVLKPKCGPVTYNFAYFYFKDVEKLVSQDKCQ